MWRIFVSIGISFGTIHALVQLECKNIGFGVTHDLGHGITVTVGNLTEVGLSTSQPCAYDSSGICHSPRFLSLSSLSSFYCTYNMSNFVVSAEGGIFPTSNGKALTEELVIFDYAALKSIDGYEQYKADVVTPARTFTVPKRIPNTHDLVVPLRVKWDFLFNHLSFEVLPIIGAAYHFYRPIWDKLSFHCSLHSAALMELLGVSASRIIVSETIQVKHVLLPATPHFLRDWILNRPAPIRGITAEVSTKVTQALLNMTIEPSVAAHLAPLNFSCISHPKVSQDLLLSSEDPFRYVVFLSRTGQHERQVYKQELLLQMISKVMNKDKYRLILMGISKEQSSIPLLHAAWQRSARIFSKAIVMMGPHGGAWNNMMFTPPDCHYVEFNILPVEHSVRDASLVRTCFQTGVFAKGGSGKYYYVQPTDGKVPIGAIYDFYRSWMHAVSHRDLLSVLLLINRDIEKQDLLLPNVTTDDATVLSMEEVRAVVHHPGAPKTPAVRVTRPPPARQNPQRLHPPGIQGNVIHPLPNRQGPVRTKRNAGGH